MRKLIYAINISVDGCCDHTKMIGDPETHEYFMQLMQGMDLLLFGRKTYQLMVPYWPDIARNHTTDKAENDFADEFASKKLVVFSRTLKDAEENTRIVRSDLKGEILKLKQENGKNILAGGVDIPSQLIELGLVDEYYFVVQPIVAGEGRRLLQGVELPQRLKLKFAGSTQFKSGSVGLHYVKP